MSALRLATFRAFRANLLPGQESEIVVIWEKDMNIHGVRGPGYIVEDRIRRGSENVQCGILYAGGDLKAAIRTASRAFHNLREQYELQTGLTGARRLGLAGPENHIQRHD